MDWADTNNISIGLYLAVKWLAAAVTATETHLPGRGDGVGRLRELREAGQKELMKRLHRHPSLCTNVISQIQYFADENSLC